MAKPLVFQYGDRELPFQISKVERSKLYGYKELEVLDGKGRECELATLAGDGQTLVGRGGTAIAYVSTDGMWCERGKLKPVDLEGREITPVPSSFNAPTDLAAKTTIEDYLDHDILYVYQLMTEEDIADLLDELKQGEIFKFTFSYRGGLEPYVAFMLMAADGNVFMTVGTRVQLEFIGFQQAGVVAAEEEAEDDEQDAMDFGMI
ncbi:MAG: hypothetical protein QGG36_08755 [Pirellulaceae bacterium]|jgi:hypothetical protein|nr:hypothetical protein [Pirellulaceae bacterium]